jgi:RHS repeat-associated protein
LGSSSLITNQSGDVVQHLEYIPFGEVFIDERPSAGSWSTPYKFNGKELDEETGLYYYGARYYDPRTSVWISVDPLAEKYPNVSSYVYCHNNPVNMIDPDGKKDVIFNADNSYKATINDNFFHNMFFGTRGIKNDSKGNSEFTFQFNNNNDADRFKLKPTEKGFLSGVDFKTFDKNLSRIVDRGIKNGKQLPIKEKIGFVYNESMPGGKLDYCGIFSSNTLYIIGNVAYDNFDAGNFIWGNSLKHLNIPFEATKIGSEYNGFWNGKQQNGEWNSSKPKYQRITWFGDSSDDQRAIEKGYYYPYIINH